MSPSVTDGHPSVRPTRELSEPRRAACAPLFGLAPARACRVSLLRRSRRHRHCGAGPRLTADGRYPLTCSMELGLSSDAAFRPMRPRPSGRLQGPIHSTRFEQAFDPALRGSFDGRPPRSGRPLPCPHRTRDQTLVTCQLIDAADHHQRRTGCRPPSRHPSPISVMTKIALASVSSAGSSIESEGGPGPGG